MINKALASILVLLMLLTSCTNGKVAQSNQDKMLETTKEIEPVIETTIKEMKVNKLNIIGSDAKTGYDIVEFGNYDKEIGYSSKIEWLLVDKNDKAYLLVSKDILDCKNYNDTKTEATFNSSTLNSWLNENFLYNAFSSDEITYMEKVSSFDMLGDGKVSILNLDACEKYFDAKEDADTNYMLSANGTAFAVSNYLEVEEDKASVYYGCGSFYLADKGNRDDRAMWVCRNGKLYTKGQSITLEHGDGVRPIIAINKELFNDVSIKKLNSSAIIESTTETEESSKRESIDENTSEVQEMEEATQEESIKEESTTEQETIQVDIDLEYDNTAREKYMSSNVPSKERNVVDIKQWEYGMTPLEWVYINPNTQIICNNTPNNSVNFSYKKQASSGSKGCFMPVFIKCNVVGDDYDGRMYSMYDYTKMEPEDMLWSDTKTFESLIYKDYQVKELLSKKYDVERVTRNLIKVKDTFVNVVYVDELDEIIEKYYK